jgi:hypothetical protein
MSFPSKTRMAKCYYCNEEMKDENLKAHCEKKHGAAKRGAGQTTLLSHFAKKSKQDSFHSDELLLSSSRRHTPESSLFSRPETPVETPERALETPDKVEEIPNDKENDNHLGQNTEACEC